MEKKGFCKEYTLDENKLIFEGEFRNHKRNGKGREYYKSGEISFIGRYLNGKNTWQRNWISLQLKSKI